MRSRVSVGKAVFLVALGACASEPAGGDEGTSSATGSSTGPSTSPSGGPSSSEAGSEDSGATTTSTGSTSSSSSSDDDDSSSTGAGVEGTLEIYWIDTEGGAATLLVTPEGPLLLADAGNPGDRDPDRIADVVQNVVGTDTIDIMLVTHYDTDHVGGVPGLAERVNIGEYWDHGEHVDSCGPDCPQVWGDYLAVADGNRTTIAAGDVRDLGGVTLRFVTAAGMHIDEPLTDGAANPACDGATKMPENIDENAMSVGFVASFGAFDFLDLGDLYWFEEHDLVCPNNLLGEVDLYQTTHHGLSSSGATQLVHGVAPLVAVMNNGATKGGSTQSFDSLLTAPGGPDIWQLHLAVNNDETHNSEDDLVANLVDGDGDEANWVRATIDGPTGLVTVHNSRNGVERSYASR